MYYGFSKAGKKIVTLERCNLEMSLNPLSSWALILQRCSIKKACVFVSFLYFISPNHPLWENSSVFRRLQIPHLPEHKRLFLTLSWLSSCLFLFFCFSDSGDIFPVPDLCLETLCMCPHLLQPHGNTNPHYTHTHAPKHVDSAETYSSPGAGPLCCSSTSENLEPGTKRRLRCILCSACQCCSFDLQPADDR